MALLISNLEAQINQPLQRILNGVNLTVNPGEVHVIMGPNGSGKSSLGKVLMGHPDYEIVNGKISIDQDDVTNWEPDTRAKSGIFLANQYPLEVPGVNLANFLRLAYNSVRAEDQKLSVFKFRQLLREKLSKVGLTEAFMERNLNEGFSGGEKKKCEILQLLLLQPKYAILDETDSGLDVDAIRVVFSNIAEVIMQQKSLGVVIITHYQRVFEYIQPDFVHVFIKGRIVESGGMDLAKRLDDQGYAKYE